MIQVNYLVIKEYLWFLNHSRNNGLIVVIIFQIVYKMLMNTREEANRKSKNSNSLGVK